MLKIKIREGTLELDEEKLIIKKTFESGVIDNVITRITNALAKKADAILLKDITLVVFESGVPDTMCPQIIIYHGKKTRLIEFCLESSDSKTTKKSDLRKVLDFFESKGIELGKTVGE